MKILFFLFLVDLQIELCFYFSRYSFLCYTIFVFFVPFIFCFVFVFLFLVYYYYAYGTCSVFLDIQVMLFLIECLLWSFQGILLLAWWSGFGLVVDTSGGVEIFFLWFPQLGVFTVTLVVCYRFYTSFSYIVYFVEFTLNKNGVNTGFFGLYRSKNTDSIFLEREEQESSYYFLHFVYASRFKFSFSYFWSKWYSFAFRVVFLKKIESLGMRKPLQCWFVGTVRVSLRCDLIDC